MGRTDEASRIIEASAVRVFKAISTPDAMAAWLAPEGMSARVEEFALRPGGRVRIELTYDEDEGHGKTTSATDVVTGEIVDVEKGVKVVQRLAFDAEDPALQGPMTTTWAITAQGMSTLVVFRADDVPDGIDPDEHRAGMESSLAKLAAYVER